MAKRGRPKKQTDTPKKEEVKEEQIENQEETLDEVETEADEIVEAENVEETPTQPTPDSDVIGEGTFSDHNPFAESVVERDYSTPKIASGVVEDIAEPQFVPPSYEDMLNNGEHQEDEVVEDTGNPFDNPNPALNELDNKDKKIACESLVDTFLDGYEQLHRYAQYVVKVDEEELLQRHQADKIDLNERIPVDEKGTEMSVSEFVAQYNEQGVEALQYDQEFGLKVRPAMVRVFMKKGWGMSDEQFLMYQFGKDIAIKVGIMFQLKKTINSTLETLEKAHKRNKRGGGNIPPEMEYADEQEEQGYEEDEFEDLDSEMEERDVAEMPIIEEEEADQDLPLMPLTPEEDFEDNTKTYNQNLNVDMPERVKPTILPKDVRDDIEKPKKKGK